MEKCLKCKKHGLFFKRQYSPIESKERNVRHERTARCEVATHSDMNERNQGYT